MDAPTTELLMTYTIGGTPIPAAAHATIGRDDALAAGFSAGRFLELEKFSFDMELKDDEGQQGNSAAALNIARAKLGSGKPFALWRSLPETGQLEARQRYRCKPEAFSITRLIDEASPALFDHCAGRGKSGRGQTANAVVIKRAMAGPDSSAVTFLRMEFNDVIITGIDWSDGEVVKETCRLTFKGLRVSYLRRKRDGTALGSSSFNWSTGDRT